MSTPSDLLPEGFCRYRIRNMDIYTVEDNVFLETSIRILRTLPL